jgi:hypothetical protein
MRQDETVEDRRRQDETGEDRIRLSAPGSTPDRMRQAKTG